MIRVVLDTNIVVSGSLWSGTPHLILQAASEGSFKPIISEAMLDELKDVIERPKFVARLDAIGKIAALIVETYASLADIIEAESIERTILKDADDDQVLACALSGHANYIVSGDPHLLDVHEFRGIPIVSAVDFLKLLTDIDDQT